MPMEMVDKNQNQNQNQNQNNDSKKKFVIFSGHDSTIVPILCSLGIYENIWPPYASNIVFEIATYKRNRNKYYIRTIYNDRIKKLPFINNDDNITKDRHV